MGFRLPDGRHLAAASTVVCVEARQAASRRLEAFSVKIQSFARPDATFLTSGSTFPLRPRIESNCRPLSSFWKTRPLQRRRSSRLTVRRLVVGSAVDWSMLVACRAMGNGPVSNDNSNSQSSGGDSSRSTTTSLRRLSPCHLFPRGFAPQCCRSG